MYYTYIIHSGIFDFLKISNETKLHVKSVFSALQVLKHKGVKSVPTLGSSGLFAFDDL